MLPFSVTGDDGPDRLLIQPGVIYDGIQISRAMEKAIPVAC